MDQPAMKKLKTVELPLDLVEQATDEDKEQEYGLLHVPDMNVTDEQKRMSIGLSGN